MEIFSPQTAANALENISVSTIEDYLSFLEKSNLIYCSPPINVGSKGALKGKPKIYVADAAIRNAVLMMDDVIADEVEMGIMVETAVYRHIVSFYQGSTAHIGYFRKAEAVYTGELQGCISKQRHHSGLCCKYFTDHYRYLRACILYSDGSICFFKKVSDGKKNL